MKSRYLIVAAIVSCTQFAWVRPELHTKAKPAGDSGGRLDYFVLKINGQPVRLKEGQEVSVMRGDELEVAEARLISPDFTAKQVDVIGFKSPGKVSGEDRGFRFKTNRLSDWYSEGRLGEVWSVIATSGDTLHGAGFIRVIDPSLRYAEIKVNQQMRVVRPGDEVIVKATDQFKVDRVVTNLGDDSSVKIRVVNQAADSKYEIRFERDRRVFAVIPVTVTE